MPDTISKLKNQLKTDDTAERCGFVLKGGKVVEVENAHPEPEKGFIIPIEALAEHEDEAVATWHTHPEQTANLSQQDHMGFRQWPSLRHYIIGVDSVRAFEVADDLVIEVDL